MFKTLRLKNFKAWRDTGELALKPVTMILGTNSSGKSTLIQSLLLLKQTVASPDRTIQLNLGGDEANDFFNFGDIENVLHQGDERARQFSIGFSFDSKIDSQSELIAFRCDYGRNSAGGVAIQEWEIKTKEHRFRSIRREKGAYSLMVGDELQPRLKGRHIAPERSVGLSAEALAFLERDGDILQDLSLAMRRELENIVYLGPLRRKPERDYVWNKTKPGEIGLDGHRAIDVLLASALLKGDEQNRIIDGVSKWLSKMKVADRLEIKQVGRSSRYELVVHCDGVDANLRDVGIGVSQVLPVLTVAYFAPEGSTVLLEEPEIHLHPMAQSLLAELFIEVSRERNLQFIVETHSEHLFRRTQTLIARQEVKATDTAMYFVEKQNKEAKIRTLNIDEYGRILDWPDKFFGDALAETREQAKLFFERHAKAKQ